MTQNNLGIAFGELAAVDGHESLRLDVGAYENALQVLTRDDYPAAWATTQNNLGTAFVVGFGVRSFLTGTILEGSWRPLR